MSPSEIVPALLSDLQRVSSEYEEVTDTDIREALAFALNHYFVRGAERTRDPHCFGMFTRRGDQLVAAAVRKFLDAVDASVEMSAVPVGQARHDLLHGPGAETPSGASYDLYWGDGDEPLSPELPIEKLFWNVEYRDEGN